MSHKIQSTEIINTSSNGTQTIFTNKSEKPCCLFGTHEKKSVNDYKIGSSISTKKIDDDQSEQEYAEQITIIIHAE